jgi:chromosome partitioning protein
MSDDVNSIVGYAKEKSIDPDSLDVFTFTSSEWEREKVEAITQAKEGEHRKYPYTIHIINEVDFDSTMGIVRHKDGIDLLPSNNTLTGIEIALAGLIGRETVLRQYIDKVKLKYDYIVIDCAPSLDLLTINALASADSVIIPVVPRFLDAKGLELLLKSIAQIRRQINPMLTISGILLTMVDRRAYFTRDIIKLVENAYGNSIRIFGEHIPRSVRASESTAEGVSIFSYEPNGRLAAAYAALTREVISDAA